MKASERGKAIHVTQQLEKEHSGLSMKNITITFVSFCSVFIKIKKRALKQ